MVWTKTEDVTLTNFSLAFCVKLLKFPLSLFHFITNLQLALSISEHQHLKDHACISGQMHNVSTTKCPKIYTVLTTLRTQHCTIAKTPVTHSRMYHRIAAGFLIWKMLSDLRIIFTVRTAILNVRNVLVASATDAMCPWGYHEKCSKKYP